jgi:hypothetical protein
VVLGRFWGENIDDIVKYDDGGGIIEMEEDTLISKIIKNRKLILLLFSLVGIVLFAVSSVGKIQEGNNKEKLVELWYEQLPHEHWMKKEDKLGGNKYIKDFRSIISSINSYANVSADISVESLDEKSPTIGSLIKTSYQHEKGKNNKKYALFGFDNKKVSLSSSLFNFNKIELSVEDKKQYRFYCEEEEMIFDCSEKQFYDEFEFISAHLVYSYIENTKIAKICNGKIFGIKKGKTKLIIGRGYNQFEYDIIIK